MGAQLRTLIAEDILAIIGTASAAAGGARGAAVLNASGSWGLSIEALADAIEEKLANRLGAVDGVAGSGKIKVVTGVTGADVDTNMAVTGIATTDELIKVVGDLAGTPTDVTSEAAITSAGNIQCTTTDHTAKTLEVWFVDNSVT